MRELLSLCLFAFASLMMMADFVAIKAKPLTYLRGIAPWYLGYLPWIGVVFIFVCWLTFRRWLGAWVPLLAYMVFLLGSMKLIDYVMDERVETIRLVLYMGSDEQEQLEEAIGERVYPPITSDHPPKLMIRRDPQIHERTHRWLAEHGR